LANRQATVQELVDKLHKLSAEEAILADFGGGHGIGSGHSGGPGSDSLQQRVLDCRDPIHGGGLLHLVASHPVRAGTEAEALQCRAAHALLRIGAAAAGSYSADADYSAGSGSGSGGGLGNGTVTSVALGAGPATTAGTAVGTAVVAGASRAGAFAKGANANGAGQRGGSSTAERVREYANTPARNGSTPLHWAAGSSNVGVMRLLLRAGADPSARTYTWGRNTFGRGSGQTPAHWVAESAAQSAQALELLLDACPLGVLAVDERGQSPRDVAEKECRGAMEALLLAREEEEYVGIEFVVDSVAARPLGAEGWGGEGQRGSGPGLGGGASAGAGAPALE
jgi:hypothetical protein